MEDENNVKTIRDFSRQTCSVARSDSLTLIAWSRKKRPWRAGPPGHAKNRPFRACQSLRCFGLRCLDRPESTNYTRFAVWELAANQPILRIMRAGRAEKRAFTLRHFLKCDDRPGPQNPLKSEKRVFWLAC